MVETAIAASPAIKEYFDYLDGNTKAAFALAQKARRLGYDPQEYVEIKLAKNMAERVVGIISVVAPQIVDSGVVERIIELEKEYGNQDWRVAFLIALEIAQQKYCSFKDKVEAIEVGVRTGFAYVTVGVVSSPLEGLTSIEIVRRRDNQGEYFRINYAGPIRNAGGTAAAVSVMIADYVRKHMGYATYDPDEKEVLRCAAELEDYHQYVANLQYFPFKEESEFLMRRIPVEIAGDPSEKREISNANLKDLPRVETNYLRSGYCLIHSSCIPLKAPKLWKKLGEWGHEMGMEDWDFLAEHIKLQKELKAKQAVATAEKQTDVQGEDGKPRIKPDGGFVADLVGGRPVLGHPMRSGAFRLRYGRSRASGYSGQSAHPATLAVLNNLIATGTQLKVERPGKAAAFTPCDTIMGPTVLLDDDSVAYLDDVDSAKALTSRVKEILYLGDALVAYGDFFDRAHVLVPPGYCEEWWALEVEKALAGKRPDGELGAVLADPLRTSPSFALARKTSEALKVPLHPKFTFFYREVAAEQLRDLLLWLAAGSVQPREASLPLREGFAGAKRALEVLGVPHAVIDGNVVVEGDVVEALLSTLGVSSVKDASSFAQALDASKPVLDIVNGRAPFVVRDKSGLFIGARMGRPEKAKMRKMTGSPHGLFPVGDEGGRLRSFNAALEKGRVTAEFPVFLCPACGRQTPFSVCDRCESKAVRQKLDAKSGGIVPPVQAVSLEGKTADFKRWPVPLRELWEYCLRKMDSKVYPDLVKGVRGTVGVDHTPEHLLKAILRAKHEVHVNKDGTVRYDASEVTLTHFKPREIGTSVERLRSLGYSHDIYGEELVSDGQVLELRAQDLVLPACPDSPDEGSDKVLLDTAAFVDDELRFLYGLEPFYRASVRDDLIGHLVVGLAPHTSAGTVGRIIGFSRTQGLLAHPLYHAAMRRDCFAYGSMVPLKRNGVWSLCRIGAVVESLSPSKTVDAFGTLEASGKGFRTLGWKDGQVVEVPVNNFTKHEPQPFVRITTMLGRCITTTVDHKHIVLVDGCQRVRRAKELGAGDRLLLPFEQRVQERRLHALDLLKLFSGEGWVMVKGLKGQLPLHRALREAGVCGSDLSNFAFRDSVPLPVATKIINSYPVDRSALSLSAKRDKVVLPAVVQVDEELLKVLGLYVAEGYARKVIGEKGLYQVYIAAGDVDVRSFVKEYFAKWRLLPSENKTDRVTYSSRLLYELFVEKLKMGCCAQEKRLPFLDLSKEKTGWLLSGYLEGDGSVSEDQLRICFDTTSAGLQRDMEFALARFGAFVKYYTYTSKPGPQVRSFYERKGLPIPEFTVTKGTIQSKFVSSVAPYVSFISSRKRRIFSTMLQTISYRNVRLDFWKGCVMDEVVAVESLPPEGSYCLNVPGNVVVADGILTKQCDGDESCFFLLMDALLNFSQKYLGTSRGSTMDAPLVLTTLLNPPEVDDMAFNVDIVDRYPLEFYEAACEYKYPWEVKIRQIGKVLFTPGQFEGMLFTHDTSDINMGVLCSAYKLLPSMGEKIEAQMDLAKRIRAVDADDVARLIIEKHFIRDTKGNLRKFSLQQFRCVDCNEKFRRPPLSGRCTSCGGRVIFTISEGSVTKYLEPSVMLADKYVKDDYLKQSLELLRVRIESYFGREKEKQTGLESWMGV